MINNTCGLDVIFGRSNEYRDDNQRTVEDGDFAEVFKLPSSHINKQIAHVMRRLQPASCLRIL